MASPAQRPRYSLPTCRACCPFFCACSRWGLRHLLARFDRRRRRPAARVVHLIAHHRPKNTVPEDYALMLEGWVRRLLMAGVKPGRITLVGFSRGGQITASASSRLASTGINTAVLAICFEGDFTHVPPIVLSGHLLSLYETTDVVGSCASWPRGAASPRSRKSPSRRARSTARSTSR